MSVLFPQVFDSQVYESVGRLTSNSIDIEEGDLGTNVRKAPHQADLQRLGEKAESISKGLSGRRNRFLDCSRKCMATGSVCLVQGLHSETWECSQS